MILKSIFYDKLRISSTAVLDPLFQLTSSTTTNVLLDFLNDSPVSLQEDIQSISAVSITASPHVVHFRHVID